MQESIKHRFAALQLDAGRNDYNTARLNGVQESGNICSRTIYPTAAAIEERVGGLEKDISA